MLKGVTALLAALTVALGCATASFAQSGKRVALVIGNSDYRFAPPIRNADREAGDVGAALEGLGFEVTRALNADLGMLRSSIASFQRSAATADAALVFYSGYSLRYRGAGYFVPVDATLKDDASFEWDTLQLAQVIGALARARMSFLVVNGCADGRLDGVLRRPGGTAAPGLGDVAARADSIIALAASDDPAACDAGGRNGLLVDAMLAQIERAGFDARTLFGRVRQVVEHRSGGKQSVAIASGLGHPFYFVQDDQPAQAFRELGVDPDLAVMRGYVEKHADSPLAPVVKAMLIQKEQAPKRPGASAQAFERWRDLIDPHWSKERQERARASRRDALEGRLSREDSDREAEARARQLREQEAQRQREAEIAAAEQKRLAEIAAAEQKRQDEERARIAREQEAQRQRDIAAAEQKRQDDERARVAREQEEQRQREAAIAEKKRQDEIAAAEQKRLADAAAAEKKRQDDERARIAREQDEQRKREAAAAAAEQKRLADLAVAEKKRAEQERQAREKAEREEKARIVREQEEQRRKDAEVAAAEKRRVEQERADREKADREEKVRLAREQEEQRKRAAAAAAAEQQRLADLAAAEKKRQEEDEKARVAREREDQQKRDAEAETARRAQLAEAEAAERKKAEDARVAALANLPPSGAPAPLLQPAPVAGNAVNEARQFTATEQRLAQERLERERKAKGENPEFAAPLPSEAAPQISPAPSDNKTQLASVAPAPADRPPPDPNFKADSPETIKAAQQELKRLGCYGGAINGNLTSSTKRALDAAGERLGLTASLQPMTEDGLRALREHQEPVCAPTPTVRRPSHDNDAPRRTARPRAAPSRPAPQTARPAPAPAPQPAAPRRPGGFQLSM